MQKISTVLIGEGSLLIECGKKALAKDVAVLGVVAKNPAIRHWAEDAEIPVFEALSDAAAKPFDWLLSIANLDMLTAEELGLASCGNLNFHDGPLPAYAGLNTPVWAILNGETHHAINWHHMVEKADAGNVVASRSFAIAADETALTLNAKCYEKALEAFDDVLRALTRGEVDGTPIGAGERRLYLGRVLPENRGYLDLNGSKEKAARLVRALDHGEYWNPMTLPKLRIGQWDFAVANSQPAAVRQAGEPGQVLGVEAAEITVQFSDGALALSGIRPLDVDAPAIVDLIGEGDFLKTPKADATRKTPEGFWRGQLQQADPVQTGLCRGVASLDYESRPLSRALTLAEAMAVASLLGQSAQSGCSFAYRAAHWEASTGFEPLTTVPALPIKPAALIADMNRLCALAATPPEVELRLRDPQISKIACPEVGVSDTGALDGIAMTIVCQKEGTALWFDEGLLAEAAMDILAARVERLVKLLAGKTAIDRRNLLPKSEIMAVTKGLNGPQETFAPETIQQMFEAQCAATPDRAALHFRGQTISYQALNARANRLAGQLTELGVGPDQFVGVHLDRSIEMVVAVLAILKAGGAYLPLDPGYPADRIAHFVKDSGCKIVVARPAKGVPGFDGTCVDPGSVANGDESDPGNPATRAGSDDLAYAIYTSGSTGLPKGVLVEHRNVQNFFVGMDQHIQRGEDDAWLALTSLSFDISVLELLYTLCRGIRLVLAEDDQAVLFHEPTTTQSIGGMDFGLFFWGNDDGPGPQKYRLLLESAKFADQNGFSSVWTPERHFHAFGGPYPNPSVTGAAVAAVTSNLAVRAGSCVAPLHHPARVAEEWAVIDNLTNGKAGLGIAAGWQPDDFLLRPENTPPNNKDAMLRAIDDIRALWRGEAVGFAMPDGTTKEVVTQPRPVSRELPLWLTIAGNPDTWREAGRIGANVLTHLLGQSVEEVGEKIALYHQALREAGHDPADFKVTLMLHSFVGQDRDEVREIVRGPLKEYLNSAAGLIKQCAWAFPAFKKPKGVTNPFEIDLETLSAEELDAILEFAFLRYFDDSGLFGTVEDCLARVAEVKALGVTEVACLIDFGIAPDVVLQGLQPLAEVVRRANLETTQKVVDGSLAGLIAQHGVTHLQSTPSMARMIAADDRAATAVRGLRQYLIGGEALNAALAEQLVADSDLSVLNMYGPTETTIWSSVEPVQPGEGIVNIGRAISNTALYVLDENGDPLGFGQEGELWIGGLGVTRGYWQQPDLTAERFAADPFSDEGRMYRTGDLVRRRADGRLDFVGRVDSQVKLRGYRIELGEIEAVLCRDESLREAVVKVAQTSLGEPVLAAFVQPLAAFDEDRLRGVVAAALPKFMQPQVYVETPEIPLTPNRKIDRNALTLPVIATPARAEIAPVGETGDPRAIISAVWCQILGLSVVKPADNFFDLGGHSLLAIQAHREIKARLGNVSLNITDIFRFPVLASLADHIAKLSTDSCDRTEIAPVKTPKPVEQHGSVLDRRRAMRAQRRAARADV